MYQHASVLSKRLTRNRWALALLLLLPLLLMHRAITTSEPVGKWDPKYWLPAVGAGAKHAAHRVGAHVAAAAGYGATIPTKEDDTTDSNDTPVYSTDEEIGIGGTNAAALHLAAAAAMTRPDDAGAAQHVFRDDGFVEPNPSAQHPIYELIARAKRAWQAKLDAQSTTLEAAVAEYRRRYGRQPPRGFDKWFKWASERGVQLLDEYDQIHRDVEPFFALPSEKLRKLREEASQREGMYTISCRAGRLPRCKPHVNEAGLNEEGKRVANDRALAQLDLIREVDDLLHDVDLVFYSHDAPWQFVGHDMRSQLEEAAQNGEYYDLEAGQHDQDHRGWQSACAPSNPLRNVDVASVPDIDTYWKGDKSLIWNHRASMDPCTHPHYVHVVGMLSSHGKGPAPAGGIFPTMAMCKTTLHSDVLAVSAEAWTEDVGVDPEWDDKKDNRLLWRGKTTGIFFKDGVPWKLSQRMNLVDHLTRKDGEVPTLPITPARNPVGDAVGKPYAELNDRLMDVAFVDDPIQCDEKVCKEIKEAYRFAPRIDWSEGNQFKYLLDVDGNGWSARFKRLMSTNSAVLKSTIFPEWYTDRVQPWVHYIPIKPDLTDLYDVMNFFQGGHDEYAKEIAQRGKAWSKSFWRKEDMVAYQLRLFLELGRLMAPDRDSASYILPGEEAGTEPVSSL